MEKPDFENEDPIMKRFRQYYHSDFTSESHNFLRHQCSRYTPFTVNGLNQLPHVFMPAVSLAMDDYAEMKTKTLESENKLLRERLTEKDNNIDGLLKEIERLKAKVIVTIEEMPGKIDV